MTTRALVRWGTAGLAGATACLGLPLLAAGGSPAAAQQASACPSASPTSTATATPSATSTATTLPAPVQTVVNAVSPTPSRSATPTSTTSATPTATTSPTACPTASATSTVTTSPSATATSTVAPSDNLGISVSPGTITPGQRVAVTVTGTPGTTVELQAYSRPRTDYRQVRTGVIGSDGRVVFSVTPGTNTRLFARIVGGRQDADSRSVVINVRTALSLTVVRNGRRDYTFQGRILPRRAGQLITLYRVDARGREILTKQIRTDSSGTYRIRRVFTGSGRFGFLTRTGQTLTNAAGVSNGGRARPTAVF